MGHSPSVAVLIPTHRRPERLSRALAALDRARGEIGFSVHVADSTPDPALRSEVAAACSEYPYVHLTHHPKHFGLVQKRNLMAREASAELLVHFVDDIYVEEDAIARLLEAYRSGEGWRIVAGSVAWSDDWTRPVVMRWIGYGRSAREGERPDFVVGAFFLCPRELAVACPYLETTPFYDDQLIGALWRAKGVELLYEPLARAFHDDEHTVYDTDHESGRVYANLFDSLIANPSKRRAVAWEILGFAAGAKTFLRRRATAFGYVRAFAGGHRRFLADRPLLRAAARSTLPSAPPEVEGEGILATRTDGRAGA